MDSRARTAARAQTGMSPPAENAAGPFGPAGLSRQITDQAFQAFAFAAAGSSQMLRMRVSGIRNRLNTKHTAGTAIG